MPDPSALKIDEFLLPIREDNPSGEDLRWEEEYALIETAREEGDDSLNKGDWSLKKPKRADWEAVISVGSRALKEKTKDIQIAGWMTEAMGRRRGLAGIRDGLRLLKALQETFWTTAYPDPTDLELREGIFDFLDDSKRLPLLLRSVPLTEGTAGYSYLKYRESRDVENDLTKTNEDLVRDLRAEIDAGRKIRAETFDFAANATSLPFARKVVDLLAECQEALDQLKASIKEPGHFGKNGPTLGQTFEALEEVTKLAVDLLEAKPGGKLVEPDPEPEPEPEPDEPEPEQAEVVNQPWGDEPKPKPRKIAPRSAGGPISSSEDARARIAEAARFLFEADQADPASYLVVRAMAMSDLYRSGETLDSSKLPPPATEDRQSLRRLSADGSWAEVLERAERVLAGREGAGWLDARRHAITALASLGHLEAERAARAVLGAELRDYPAWPQAELDDGTPSASSETRAWLLEAFPPAEAAPTYTPSYAPVEDHRPTPSNGEAEDPWDQVQAMLRDGRSQEAIATVSRAVREARTGRERFLRTFQQAEVCLTLGRPGVATTLLEGLARQIDELRLDHWEDTTLCARVVASLYRCLKGKDDARARSVYERLCQLDIGQAMSLGDLGDA